MRIWGQKKYRPGAVWAVERKDRPFHFIIIGPGRDRKHRRCSVVHKYSHDEQYNFESEYSLAHLRKHAACIKEGE